MFVRLCQDHGKCLHLCRDPQGDEAPAESLGERVLAALLCLSLVYHLD